MLALLILAGVLCALGEVAHADPESYKGPRGAYKVTCRGSYVGDGTAAVGAQSVTLNVQLRNPQTGVSGHLVAPDLDLDRHGGFVGTGKFDGEEATVSGRVDARDGQIVTRSRIVGTVKLPDGLHTRFVGDRKGS